MHSLRKQARNLTSYWGGDQDYKYICQHFKIMIVYFTSKILGLFKQIGVIARGALKTMSQKVEKSIIFKTSRPTVSNILKRKNKFNFY